MIKDTENKLHTNANVFTYGLLAIICLCLVTIGPVAAGEIEKHADIAGWQTYSNAESNLTFKYPKDWETADEGFYVTAGGSVANQWSVRLQKIEGDEDSNDWIRINPRQFDESDGICTKVGEESICTYSTDQDVLNIFNIICRLIQPSASNIKTPPHTSD
jgi:hypothetical protein